MVSQHKFKRMRVQVVLSFQVRLIVFPHVVVEDCDGDYEGDESFVIAFYDLQQFLLLIGGKMFFEVTHDVREDIGVLSRCGDETKPFHHGFDIDVI